jgi:hypothetical protein
MKTLLKSRTWPVSSTPTAASYRRCRVSFDLKEGRNARHRRRIRSGNPYKQAIMGLLPTGGRIDKGEVLLNGRTSSFNRTRNA